MIKSTYIDFNYAIIQKIFMDDNITDADSIG